MKPKFKDIPLSNFDLLNWIDYLRVPNFKGIFSRDSKNHLHKMGSCIINLDDGIDPGMHWVATFIADDFIYYFDSFSLPPPQEFVEYKEKLGKRFKFNYGYPIQDITSVRCRYYCLYFLDNIHKKSFCQCLEVFKLNDTDYNEKFIKDYLTKKNETRLKKLFQRIETCIDQIH